MKEVCIIRVVKTEDRKFKVYLDGEKIDVITSLIFAFHQITKFLKVTNEYLADTILEFLAIDGTYYNFDIDKEVTDGKIN